MSGHSKWSKVKHQKAVTDVVKAKAFTKASRGITIAVREGGGSSNPDDNFKLRLAMEKAREVNMPKDNIDRAIAKAKGEGADVVESFLYEAIGPGKVALLIDAATENRQRTVSQIKNVLERNGGVLAAQGAVSFQFSRQGVVVIERPATWTDDQLFDIAVESGAQDVVPFDTHAEFYTDSGSLEQVKKNILEKGMVITTAAVVFRPGMPLAAESEIIDDVDTLVEALEELDDVQQVYTNLA